LSSNTIKKYVERFKERKTEPEHIFYNNHYPTLYSGFIWYMNDFKLYLKEDPKTSYPEFWHWYTTRYLPEDIYYFIKEAFGFGGYY